MSRAGIAGIVLAAGASTRLGEPKQLVRFHGEALVARAVRFSREAGTDPVFVVVGSDAAAVVGALDPGSVHCIPNARWTEGLASSIRAGLQALADDPVRGALLVLPDQARVEPEHLRALVERFEAIPEQVVASAYAGRVGAPAVVPRELWSTWCAFEGDRGARDWIAANPERVEAIACEDAAFDLDEPEDLARLRADEHPER